MSDSTKSTMAHKNRVKELMTEVIQELDFCATVHDNSKLQEPEKSAFDRATPRLKHLKYGTPKYKEALKHLGSALDHHYKVNRHHPEHWELGIYGMDLLDLIELLADWKAAGERHEDNKGLRHSIEVNAERYGYDERFKELLLRTADRMGWL